MEKSRTFDFLEKSNETGHWKYTNRMRLYRGIRFSFQYELVWYAHPSSRIGTWSNVHGSFPVIWSDQVESQW